MLVFHGRAVRSVVLVMICLPEFGGMGQDGCGMRARGVVDGVGRRWSLRLSRVDGDINASLPLFLHRLLIAGTR